MCHRLAFVIIGVLASMILLFGCSQPTLNVKPIAKTEHPAALLGKLAQNLAAAKEKRVDLLSPTWFDQAQASYNRAKTGLDAGAELSKILSNIANGRAQLAQASSNAEKSKKHLAEVIKSRDAGYAAGADRYKKAFVKLESDFIKLTKAVEDGDLGYVRKKKKAVNSQYRELELRAIKDDNLTEVRRLMQTAASRDMDETAPKSYLVAQSKLREADMIITKNRYDKQAIDSAVDQALFYAQRLHHMAGVSQKVEEMAPEEIALWMERFLAQTNTHLKERDRRNLPFKDQQEVILSAIASLQRNQSSSSSQVQSRDLEIQKLKQRIAQLEGRTYKERADKERLAAEKRFNEIYTKVQGYFSADQAEVYKKSQQLVIRLKAMRFPVGQAVVVPSNYPLLTTVRKAILAFGKPDVVIEGHTDSTGSEALNLKLSRSRAESVQQYLIYNGTLSADKIAARGYGSSRPLASNATARGRAINRRIDVIIKPVR
ncbi:MAG: OmpA family protein [Desulfobacteraceae bacterium]